jgi:predicted MFS family arabinose efflux permease
VIVLCVVIVLAITGQYTFYTYMAPWFLDVAHLSSAAVPGLLFLYGAGGALGLVLAGFAADRFPKRGFAGVLLLLMAAVVVLAVGAGSVPVVLAGFLTWGVAFGAVPPLLQTRMMRTASRRVRDLAGALQTTAFNVGIGGGSLLGALLLAGPGMRTLPLTTVLLVASGLVLALLPELLRRPAALRPATAK